MLHEIDKTYHCEYIPTEPDYQKDYLLSFDGDSILFIGSTLPLLSEVLNENDPENQEKLQFLFTVSGVSFFMSKETIPPSGNLTYKPIRALREHFPQWLSFAGVTGYHLSIWYNRHKFCGHCATPLVHKENERALVCPDCGQTFYPNINVAIIVGVTDGDRILLTKYSGRAYTNYALVAGFVEIGETLEDCIRREVMEEVGVHVKNIRYFDNQPWGFSQSILVGFFADLDGDGEIVLDPNELSEGVWVDRKDMPVSDPRIAMTSKMMEAFRNGQDV